MTETIHTPKVSAVDHDFRDDPYGIDPELGQEASRGGMQELTQLMEDNNRIACIIAKLSGRDPKQVTVQEIKDWLSQSQNP